MTRLAIVLHVGNKLLIRILKTMLIFWIPLLLLKSPVRIRFLIVWIQLFCLLGKLWDFLSISGTVKWHNIVFVFEIFSWFCWLLCGSFQARISCLSGRYLLHMLHIIFSIYHLLEPFISLWLGPEFIIDHMILVLLTIYTYISYSRFVVDTYNHAYGLYNDTWSAWAELVINLSITLIAGYFWGIIGLLLGKIISTGLIVILWKPYFLFSSGLKERYSVYWSGAARNFGVSIVSFTIAHYLTNAIQINAYSSYLLWSTYSIYILTVYLIINLTLIRLFCKGSKDFLSRIKQFVKKK